MNKAWGKNSAEQSLEQQHTTPLGSTVGMSSIGIQAEVFGRDLRGECGFARDRVRSCERRHRAARAIHPAVKHMQQHLNKPLQVSMLSSMAAVSSSHFYSLFKRATGYTPINFFIRLRMIRACEMLATSTVTVKGIAAALGYADRYYFSRLFKSIVGVAPREYREKMLRSRSMKSL
jgi:transcriptional regulator GlxA family with amidase domain